MNGDNFYTFDSMYDEPEPPKEYNKTIHEGYKAGRFRRDGSVSSISKINTKDIENVICSQNLGFIPDKFIRLDDIPQVQKHSCVMTGVTKLNAKQIMFYNTPIYYTACSCCRKVYYYCVKVKDLEMELFFKSMGLYPRKFIQLDASEFNQGYLHRIRHCCKATGIAKMNLIKVPYKNYGVSYAICQQCGNLYYFNDAESVGIFYD